VLYGRKDRSLARTLGISMMAAQRLIDRLMGMSRPDQRLPQHRQGVRGARRAAGLWSGFLNLLDVGAGVGDFVREDAQP
jgi:hypothetical protein